MPSLIAQLHHSTPQSALIGSELVVLPAVDSTQNVVRAAALRDEAEGLVVVAGQQTAGKGRLGRDWWSPADGGLYLSLLLRPRIPPDRLAWVTMAVSLGAAEAIELVCNVTPDLKWPNDLTWQGRKLAGVLAEASFVDGQVAFVVAGIGLNVQTDFSQRADLAELAVSLHEITSQPVPLELLLSTLLARIEVHYLALQDGVSPQPRWAARLANLGQPVVVTSVTGEALTGVAEQVQDDGRLLLRLASGESVAVSAGDVTLAPPVFTKAAP